MRITIFGATGRVGSRAVAEALARDHEVTAVGRDEATLDEVSDGASTAAGDATNPGEVARLTANHDVVISATGPSAGETNELAEVARGLLKGLAGTEARLIVVGGAGPLQVPGGGGTLAIDDPAFVSESAKGVAQACIEQLDVFRTSDTSVDWAYLSPSADMQPGDRTGSFRTGTDELIVDANGSSRISMEDLAVALINEAENPQHHQTQFTVGY